MSTSTTIEAQHAGQDPARMPPHVSAEHAGDTQTTPPPPAGPAAAADPAAAGAMYTPAVTSWSQLQSGGKREKPAGSKPVSRRPNPVPARVTAVPPAAGPSVRVTVVTAGDENRNTPAAVVSSLPAQPVAPAALAERQGLREMARSTGPE